MTERMNITSVLDQLDAKAEGDRLTVGNMVDAIGGRGYGPLIMAAALVEIMPTGGIPGIPTLVATTVILFSVQLVLGRPKPWLPERLRKKGVARHRFDKARDKVRPVTLRVDRVFKPRLHWLVTPFASRVAGLFCILFALTMPPLEIIPWLGYVPALAILFLAAGISAQDGLFVLLGFLVAMSGLLTALNLLVL